MKLDIKNLSKKYNDKIAVDRIDYSMEQGIYGLLGTNGAGKTTLMKLICTLDKPTDGEITFDGKNIFELGEDYRDKIGYLPQDFGYYPDLSVYDFMMYLASLKGINPGSSKKKIEELLKKVGMFDVKKQKMKTLSGGMIRRVGIAQAMLNDPEILILDEPTSGLDPNERIRFRKLISELSENRLVLLSTHIVSDVEFIANEIILMKDGKFLFAGIPDEIISSMKKSVWNVIVQPEEVDDYSKKYLVANEKFIENGVELRIISEHIPKENAVLEKAALEDAFLLFFGEKASGENHAEI